MVRQNFFSFIVYLFYALFVLSFFHSDFEDLRILLLSYSIMVFSLLTLSLKFLYEKKPLSINIIKILLLLWLTNATLPVVFNIVQPTAQFGLFQCCVWVFSFFIIASSENSAKNWNQFKKLIFVLGVIFSSWALAQHYIYHHMASGPFGTRNSNGAFLMLTALIICSELLRYSTGQEKINIIFFSRRRILYTVAFFIVNLGLLLSFSRGIYLSYGFSLLFLFIINANRSTLKIILGLSTILLLSLIFLYLTASESIQHRFDMLEHEKSRMIIWKGAWHLWRESAWYGIGIENFKYFYQAFSLPGDGSSLENAHNDYLQLLIETGIPGITIIAALILIFFYYFIRYLRSSNPVSSSRATITTQFAMVSSLAMYSVVDFVFYIFSFNILLGVLLGFFYQHLKDQGCVHPIINITFSYKKNFIVLLAGVFLFITNLFTHLFLYSFYTAQANDYIKHERLPEATKSYHQAKQHFNTPYAYNNLVSLYLEQAKMASDPSGKLNLIDKAERIIAETIALHPYNAEPYFQQGIIYALYYNEIVKAQTAFETFLQLKPHANFERLTFCYFLLEQDQTHYAQSILEKGLLYPIDRYYAPKYLELLANLRLENGDIVGSQKIVEALSDLDNYRLDYSAFAN